MLIFAIFVLAGIFLLIATCCDLNDQSEILDIKSAHKLEMRYAQTNPYGNCRFNNVRVNYE